MKHRKTEGVGFEPDNGMTRTTVSNRAATPMAALPEGRWRNRTPSFYAPLVFKTSRRPFSRTFRMES